MRQFAQQILPAGMPATTVWGYGAIKSASKKGLLIHNAPSLTIEAQVEPAGAGQVDQRPGGRERQLPAAPAAGRPDAALGQPAGRRRRAATRARLRRDARPYTGPVPIVTHVHGAVGVGDESDGYAEAWYLPAATNIPAGYATEGTWYDFFAGKAAAKFGVDVGPGLRDLPVPERPARVDDLVPRPRAGHDPAERVRRPGRLLHRPRRPGGRQGRAGQPHPAPRRCCRARRPRKATSSRPTRPTTRSRSRSRTGRSTPTARCSTRTRGRSSTGSCGRYIPDDGRSRRSGTRSSSAT